MQLKDSVLYLLHSEHIPSSLIQQQFEKYHHISDFKDVQYISLSKQATSDELSLKLSFFDAIRHCNQENQQDAVILLLSLDASQYVSEFRALSSVPIVSLEEQFQQHFATVYPCIKQVALLGEALPNRHKVFKKQYTLQCLDTEQHKAIQRFDASDEQITAIQQYCEDFIQNEADIIAMCTDSALAHLYELRKAFPTANPLKVLFKSLKQALSSVSVRRPFTLGVVGGMGPLATLDFVQKIIAATQAESDQEHMPICVEHQPTIPDRTASINQEGDDALFGIYDAVKRLEQRPVSAIAVPCNTAHYFLNQFKQQLSLPLIDIIEHCIRYIRHMGLSKPKVGLLATKGSIRSGIYSDTFENIAADLELFIPSKTDQDSLMTAIYDVKRDPQYNKEACRQLLMPCLENFASKGVSVCILGCTELPLLFHHLEQVSVSGHKVIFIDPTTILAEACVAYFNQHKKGEL